MYTYMLLFISSYWKISIKLCLKHLWQYVILWIGNLTGHSYVFKNSHNVILVIICGSVLQCNSNFHKISNIFQSAKHVVIHCLKKKKTWKQKQQSLYNVHYILMNIPRSCNISFPCFTVTSLEFSKQSSSMASINGNINPVCLNFPPPYKW